MKEQRTKQILICLAASLGCFWLGNRVGLLYVSAAGTVTQRLAAAVNLSKIVLHPLQLSPAPIPVGCGVGAILLAGLAYFCIKYSGHRLVPQKEYGSARWGTAADIAPFLHEKPSENIPLTATESLSLAMKMPVTAENNYNRNKNVIVFGPSGSGKSYSVAGPQLLQFNSNYVLSDPKGELLDTYGNVLVSQGYDVKVFNLKDRDKSDHYNPFAYIHDTDDIVVVAKNLIKNMKEDPRQKNTADPIWEEGSTSLLEALLAYVYFEQPPEMHNMNSVMELFVLMENFALSTTNRTRPICKPVYFTEDEWLSVATKMAESDMPNFSAFCREMLLTGKVKHYDFSVIKEISSSLSHISGNINQVAKRCNTNQSVTTNDVEQLRREYLQLKSLYQERLVKALRKLV